LLEEEAAVAVVVVVMIHRRLECQTLHPHMLQGLMTKIRLEKYLLTSLPDCAIPYELSYKALVRLASGRHKFTKIGD